MKSAIALLLLYLSFTTAFSTLPAPTTRSLLHIMSSSKGSNKANDSPEKDYLSSLSSNPIKKKNKNILSNNYLNSIDKPSVFARIRRSWTDMRTMDTKSLAKLGANTLLAYLFISNASGCIMFSCAWFLASKQTGLSPMAPGQWKTFSAIYAGFFLLSNIVRPARVGLALALGPSWNNMIIMLQRRFKVNQTVAIGLVMFFVNILGSCAIMATGVALASLLSGVPIWAK